MKWYKAYANLKGHPKRFAFEEKLGVNTGLHYIHLWFSYIAEYAEDGDVTALTPVSIARACEWGGDPQVFFEALTVSGFIEKTRGGEGGFRLIAHDWFEENSRFLKENKRPKPTGNPRETHGLPLGQDKTGQDRTENQYSEKFEIRWGRYPSRKGRKNGKAEAWVEWCKLGLEGRELTDIDAGIERAKGEELPLDFCRWLKRKRWEDEVVVGAVLIGECPKSPKGLHGEWRAPYGEDHLICFYCGFKKPKLKG